MELFSGLGSSVTGQRHWLLVENVTKVIFYSMGPLKKTNCKALYARFTRLRNTAAWLLTRTRRHVRGLSPACYTGCQSWTELRLWKKGLLLKSLNRLEPSCMSDFLRSFASSRPLRCTDLFLFTPFVCIHFTGWPHFHVAWWYSGCVSMVIYQGFFFLNNAEQYF